MPPSLCSYHAGGNALFDNPGGRTPQIGVSHVHERGPMTECENCGTHVTTTYARVFGDNQGRVHGCYDCMNRTAIQSGEAADHAPEL